MTARRERFRRAIVAFPVIETPHAWARVCSFRDRYDPLAAKVAPHLTLVFPFEDPVSNDDLAAEVRGAVAGVGPVRLVLRGVTAHEGEFLFLNVVSGNDGVVALHDGLYRGVLARHRSRMHTFVPHVTVGRVAPEDLAAAVDAGASLEGVVVAWVDRVTLYEISPDGTRPCVFDVPLAGP